MNIIHLGAVLKYINMPRDIRRLIMIAAAPQKALKYYIKESRLDMVKIAIDLGADATEDGLLRLSYDVNITKYLIKKGAAYFSKCTVSSGDFEYQQDYSPPFGKTVYFSISRY